ncbi:hypothetical protein ACFQZT_14550 [Paenibacillus sp. GCM10027628]|uniref:hypothetical protein n=1 Tax=Paenibacillus sp. GCM10027628 TaxID=3273413 RepID=UPI00362A1452
MRIAVANNSDYGYIQQRDHHILQGLIIQKIKGNEIYILRDEDENYFGWMRYGYLGQHTIHEHIGNHSD